MFLVLDGKIAGFVAVADPVKETTPAAIKELHELEFRVIMATGDNERTAKAIGARLGSDEIRADVLPEDKARIIKELQQEGRKVAMAGDGVNDASALAQADVGIAMGPAPMWPSKARASHWSRATSTGSCVRGGWPEPPCGTSARTCSSR